LGLIRYKSILYDYRIYIITIILGRLKIKRLKRQIHNHYIISVNFSIDLYFIW